MLENILGVACNVFILKLCFAQRSIRLGNDVTLPSTSTLLRSLRRATAVETAAKTAKFGSILHLNLTFTPTY